MNTNKKRWCAEDGSLDLIQLVIGSLIVGIAAVGTYQALYFGTTQLDSQMRYRKAISVARGYAEYWQGRIHTDFPDATDPRFLGVVNGNLTNPVLVRLDERDPNVLDDDIWAEVMYRKLVPYARPGNLNELAYWQINVIIRWWEPGEQTPNSEREIEFVAAMAPAAL